MPPEITAWVQQMRDEDSPHPDAFPLWDHPPGPQMTDGYVRPTLTAYPVMDNTMHGAVIVIPGGGYVYKAMQEVERLCSWYQRRGIHAFALDYRLYPVQHPWPLRDAQRAVRTVRAHAATWHVDPQRIAVMGFSAGGHVAASVAVHHDAGDPQAQDPVERVSCRPDAAVLTYPVISMRPGITHPGSRDGLLGDHPDPEAEAMMSLDEQMHPGVPPLFTWHTLEDTVVPPDNSIRLAQAARACGVPVELHLFQHGEHGRVFAMNDPQVHQWMALQLQFLRQLGW